MIDAMRTLAGRTIHTGMIVTSNTLNKVNRWTGKTMQTVKFVGENTMHAMKMWIGQTVYTTTVVAAETMRMLKRVTHNYVRKTFQIYERLFLSARFLHTSSLI